MSNLALLPPEARLLLLCTGGGHDEAIRRLLSGPLEWSTVLQLAEREGAAPLLQDCLARLGAGDVPTAAAERLRSKARVTRFKMLYLEQRVQESVSALDGAGIPSVLLKGAALAVSVYGAFERRPMVDFDVLVHRADAKRALDVLLTAGWVWRSDRPWDADYSHLHHLPMLLDARGVAIGLELHTALLPDGQPFRLEAEEVLNSAQPSRIGRVPDPYHMLVHAAIHLVWGHLLRKGAVRTFRDVAMILETFRIETAPLVTVAAAARATTVCYWTLRLASAFGGVTVPRDLLVALRPPWPEAALRAMERHFGMILFPVAGCGCPSVRLRQIFWSAAILPRWSGHDRSRPWEVLALKPEDRSRNAIEAARRGVPEPSQSPSAWMHYLRRVLLPGSVPARVT